MADRQTVDDLPCVAVNDIDDILALKGSGGVDPVGERIHGNRPGALIGRYRSDYRIGNGVDNGQIVCVRGEPFVGRVGKMPQKINSHAGREISGWNLREYGIRVSVEHKYLPEEIL